MRGMLTSGKCEKKPSQDVSILPPATAKESDESYSEDAATGRSTEGADGAVPEESDEELESFDDGHGLDENDGPRLDDIVGPGRPQRERHPRSWHQDYDMEYAAYALTVVPYVQDVPKSLAKAQKRDDWCRWQQAVDQEMSSMLKNEIWGQVQLPADRTSITSKGGFKVKRGVNGEPDSYKALLVAKGFTQRYGFDYCETYSPLAK